MKILVKDDKEKNLIKGMCHLALKEGGFDNREAVNLVWDSVVMLPDKPKPDSPEGGDTPEPERSDEE